MENLFSKLNFDKNDLIPAIIQDNGTSKVLTLCYMNKETLKKTMEEGKIFLFRRSKNKVMMKGQTSGHIQFVKELYLDCEGNSLLFKVDQKVAACHQGYFTCYFRKAGKDGALEVVGKKIFEPGEKYK